MRGVSFDDFALRMGGTLRIYGDSWLDMSVERAKVNRPDRDRRNKLLALMCSFLKNAVGIYIVISQMI